MAVHLFTELLKTLLCLCLLMLPLLAAWISRFSTLPRRFQAGIAVILISLGVAAYLLHFWGTLHVWTMPWLFHVLGSENIFVGSWDMLGNRPVSIPIWLRAILSLFVIASTLTFAADLVHRRTRGERAQCSTRSSWRLVAIMFAPYALACVVLWMPRGLYLFIYDRYLLSLMPIAILCLLKIYQEQRSKKLPTSSYLVLAVFSAYGILATHDLFAVNRARIIAVNRVLASGVPRTAVQAGFEYDGWTQLSEAGHVNEPKVTIPSGAYHFNQQAVMRPMRCRSGFDKFTPDLDCQYLVVFTPMECLLPSEFAPQTYTGWLPPFHRSLYIQRVPPLAVQDPGDQ
jgi:hypothetical protein